MPPLYEKVSNIKTVLKIIFDICVLLGYEANVAFCYWQLLLRLWDDSFAMSFGKFSFYEWTCRLHDLHVFQFSILFVYVLNIFASYNCHFLRFVKRPFFLQQHVLGELYQVNEDQLECLDALENHPNFYKRVEIPVRVLSEAEKKLSPNTIVQAWCYFLFDFVNELLNKPFLRSYDASAEPKYVARDKRSADVKPIQEVKMPSLWCDCYVSMILVGWTIISIINCESTNFQYIHSFSFKWLFPNCSDVNH